jgi:carboxypeptidase Taq
MTREIVALRERLAELEDLQSAGALLSWDQQVMMPPRGAPQRANALATIERVAHEQFIAAETGRLLEAAETAIAGERIDPDSDDARLVRLVTRRWAKARRVPSALAAEIAKAGSVGQDAWVAARREGDFAAFAPFLSRNLELARQYADCFDGFDCAYDALLDDYEPDMSAARVTSLFDDLKAELVPVIAQVAPLGTGRDCLFVNVPIDRQRRLVAEVLAMMGFDASQWRIDEAAHPFATSFGASDVRITTRWDESYFPAGLFGAMHECGHGLYEAGIAPALQRSALGHGESLGMHESQSRLWENMVGRSRAFSGVLAKKIAETFGGELADLDPETLFQATNQVTPSFIRVEADEATYGLHIVLRFELEQELIEGRLRVDEVPEAWAARMHEYLGLDVTDPADGALQDVHWSAGLIGYFPTYALGNMIAGQLWQQVNAEIPDLDDQIAAGELGGLRDWLVQNVHRHGSKFRTHELLERIVGAPIEVGPFARYLKEKLGDVYGLPLA